MASPLCSSLRQLSIFGPRQHEEQDQTRGSVDSKNSNAKLIDTFRTPISTANYPSKSVQKQSQPQICTLVTKLDVHLRCRIWAFAVTQDEPIIPYSRITDHGRDAERQLRQIIESTGTESISRLYLPKKLTIRDLTLACKDIRSDILNDHSFYRHNEFHFTTLAIAAYYLHTLSLAQRRLITSMSLLYTHAYHAPDVFEMVLECQNLRSLHLDLSPLYYPFEGRITIPPAVLDLPPKFHYAEESLSRITPPMLETGLEDFTTRTSFYPFMKRIQNMKNLREFKLIGRASDEEQVRVPRPQVTPQGIPAFQATPAPAAPAPAEVSAVALGYNVRTGLLPPQLKTEIFLPLSYGKTSPQSQESEEPSGEVAQ